MPYSSKAGQLDETDRCILDALRHMSLTHDITAEHWQAVLNDTRAAAAIAKLIRPADPTGPTPAEIFARLLEQHRSQQHLGYVHKWFEPMFSSGWINSGVRVRGEYVLVNAGTFLSTTIPMSLHHPDQHPATLYELLSYAPIWDGSAPVIAVGSPYHGQSGLEFFGALLMDHRTRCLTAAASGTRLQKNCKMLYVRHEAPGSHDR